MLRVSGWCSRRWPSVLSAGLLLLAFPPFDLWPLVFVAVVPLLWQLRSVDAKEAWRIGYLFGLVYFGGQIVWLFQFVQHWTHSPWLAGPPCLVLDSMGALYFGWFGVLTNRSYRTGWIWLIPVAWAGIEAIRSYMPVVAFPWGLVATPLYPAPALVQLAHYGGIYLVSAWIVLCNMALAMLVDAETRKVARPYGIAFGVLLLVSLVQYNLRQTGDPLVVLDGQPAVDRAFGNADTAATDIATSVNALTAKAIADRVQLMILPEGIGDDNHYPPAPPFRIDPRLPIVFGGQRLTKDALYQTSFSYDGHWQYADKTRLVIFGEFVPGRSLFPGLAKAFDLPSGDLSAGREGVKPLDVAGVRVGPMLCFEGLFPDIAFRQAMNGSRFLTVMSIDDWYMGTNAPEQLMAASIFRAVETGLPLVRSASLGITLVLDAHGHIVSRLPVGKPGGLKATLLLPRQSPLFPLLPFFPIASAIATVTLLFWTKRLLPTAKDSRPRPPKDSDSEP